MKNDLKNVLIGTGITGIIVGCVLGGLLGLDYINEQFQSETIELTIEYLWEEDSKYYFADSNSNVYKLGNYRKRNDKIMYDDLPKQRFERLNVDSRYEVEYISGMDYWSSISEKEV